MFTVDSLGFICSNINLMSMMRYGVDSFSPSSWEPQEEGMMNIAARFSLSKKPWFINPKGKKPIRLKVMLASLVTLQ
jgi:hypothetical protein